MNDSSVSQIMLSKSPDEFMRIDTIKRREVYNTIPYMREHKDIVTSMILEMPIGVEPLTEFDEIVISAIARIWQSIKLRKMGDDTPIRFTPTDILKNINPDYRGHTPSGTLVNNIHASIEKMRRITISIDTENEIKLYSDHKKYKGMDIETLKGIKTESTQILTMKVDITKSKCNSKQEQTVYTLYELPILFKYASAKKNIVYMPNIYIDTAVYRLKGNRIDWGQPLKKALPLTAENLEWTRYLYSRISRNQNKYISKKYNHKKMALTRITIDGMYRSLSFGTPEDRATKNTQIDESDTKQKRYIAKRVSTIKKKDMQKVIQILCSFVQKSADKELEPENKILKSVTLLDENKQAFATITPNITDRDMDILMLSTSKMTGFDLSFYTYKTYKAPKK